MLDNTVSARPASPPSDPPILAVTSPRLPSSLAYVSGPPRLQYDSSWVMPVYEARSSDMAATAAATSGSSSSPVTGSTSRRRLGTPSSNVRTMTRSASNPSPAWWDQPPPAEPSRTTPPRYAPTSRMPARTIPAAIRNFTCLCPPPAYRNMRLGARRSVTVAGFEDDRSIGSGWRATARRRGLQPSTLPRLSH